MIYFIIVKAGPYIDTEELVLVCILLPELNSRLKEQ